MLKQNNWIDRLTSKAIESGSKPLFQGAAASGLSVALISVTPAVPENWEGWFQWPCFVIFSAGGIRMLVAIFWN